MLQKLETGLSSGRVGLLGSCVTLPTYLYSAAGHVREQTLNVWELIIVINKLFYIVYGTGISPLHLASTFPPPPSLC